MANNTLRFQGLEELRAELRQLADDLKGEAAKIIHGRANAAAVDIRSAYGAHRHSGDLQEHVVVEQVSRGRFSAGAIVRNTAKHAFIFENGTEARHTKAGLNRGKMPPGHIFVPRMMKHRRLMYAELAELLRRHGMTVVGDAA